MMAHFKEGSQSLQNFEREGVHKMEGEGMSERFETFGRVEVKRSEVNVSG